MECPLAKLTGTPARDRDIFIKTVFEVEKCLASPQGLSRRTHFLLSEYCSFF